MSQPEILLTTVDQIPRGEGRMFAVAGESVAVFHTHAGEVFATQSHCPHLAGPLADGLMGGASIVCPLHDRVFDLRTGCGLSHENMTIAVYPTRLGEGGSIWLTPVPNITPTVSEGAQDNMDAGVQSVV